MEQVGDKKRYSKQKKCFHNAAAGQIDGSGLHHHSSFHSDWLCSKAAPIIAQHNIRSYVKTKDIYEK